jgi:hypothetical protein
MRMMEMMKMMFSKWEKIYYPYRLKRFCFKEQTKDGKREMETWK